jgi:hypothetical protein
MTSETEALLLHQIQPRLRAAIPKAVPMIGSDDLDELVQDGLAIALHLYRAARDKGKAVSAANVAHYAVGHLRTGRRSTGERRSDALAPACQLSGRSSVCSLDAPLSSDDHSEDPLTLHDSLASSVEDPATAAARRLDWQLVLRSLDPTGKAILMALVEGRALTRLVRRLNRSSSALHDQKKRLGILIKDRLGPDILTQAQARPFWASSLDAAQQRQASRAQRRA